MKKSVILKIVAVGLIIGFLTACSGMSVGVGYGVNFAGGPYGPMVTPSVNVGMYGGHVW
ncbi:hypothetical protein D3C80_1892780 [compost metagenome]